MEYPQQRFACLNCQLNLRLDSAQKKHDGQEADKKFVGQAGKEGEMIESLSGQSKNLMKLICDAQCPSDVPVCKECCDVLESGIDTQLANLEEECASYNEFLKHLKMNHSGTNLAEMRNALQNAQDEERLVKQELQRITREEAILDEQLQATRREQEEIEIMSSQMWKTYRDNLKKHIDTQDMLKMIDAERRYADLQLKRLADANVLDTCFHIWFDDKIGEINGFRLGCLDETHVDWTELNAAWGQVVMLLDILMERLNIKHDVYVPVAMGSNSYIKMRRNNMEAFPLYGSGTMFGSNNCVDKGIQCFLQLLLFLQKDLKARNNEFNPAFKIQGDKLFDNQIGYTGCMMLNIGARWTQAMNLMLMDLKTAIAQVISLRAPA